MATLTLAEFAAFSVAHQAAIARHIARIVHDADLAADLTQDTFTRALVALQSGTQVTTPAWIYRIATNCALDELRRRRVIRQIPFADLTLAESDAGFDAVAGGNFPEAIAEQDAVRRAWAQLSGAERACLAASLVTVPVQQPARAKMRLSRARHHLRAIYRQEVAV
ncbi:MAG: RNA polymerase sigma factor [Ktedonobacterales bacterium]|nr:RNA polymerase sigma factor [Ktedonobacterales bacterium]